MRGPWWFVFLIFLIAGVYFRVNGMIVPKLAFDSWLRQMRRQCVLDPDTLVERDEAQDVQSEVRGSHQMITFPFFIDEVLNQLTYYSLFEVEAPSGNPLDDWHKGEVKNIAKDELLNRLHMIIRPTPTLMNYPVRNKFKLGMISTFTKKLIGLEKKVRPYVWKDRNKGQALVIWKGYQPHFQWMEENQKQVGDRERIYIYDRCSVDTALEMAARKTYKLSFISTRNYETVVAVAKNGKQPEKMDNAAPTVSNGLFKKILATQGNQTAGKRAIDRQISAKAKNILANYSFTIQNSYLDIHPLQGYQKICGYLMTPAQQSILSLFQGFNYGNQSLLKSFLILPLMTKLRNKYLMVEGIKLGRLQRKSNITIEDEDIQRTLQQWRTKVQLQAFKNAYNSFEQREKIQWVMSNNLCESISKKDVLHQRYRRYSYATMD